ncbi:ImmA/IrrE family metallo-endopeptidase [Burkholderia vietnamiensis]|uniref:ImmA/IrrE family metallo-endopeptidase n=1 Tax=Burkholderia vietnamiensis TaxID=60552 RepID=UPI0009C01A09|nr:ImmA/IrrE family metallo-endopeptidase [Burkholderia vietnamiensis]
MAGESLQSFAEDVAKRDRDRAAIVDGKLTVTQAERLAKRAGIPFGFLFLDAPPAYEKPRIPDLRQMQESLPLSTNFYETLEDIIAKQQWFVEYLSDVGAGEIPFVGRFHAKTATAPEVARDIQRELALSDDDRRTSPDAGAYFSALSKKAEARGILVFKTSYVKSNTRRSISENEFRGFAIADRYAPVAFVNGNDVEVAAVFTLIHEIAHIWLGVTGVSDLPPTNIGNPVERLCNRVAADILVPSHVFQSRWQGIESLDTVAAYFRVSKVVIARRALDSGLISQQQYQLVAQNSKKRKPKGKPSALITIPIRNSKRFTRTIVASAMSGKTLLRDAANLLNVKPDTVVSLARGRSENG